MARVAVVGVGAIGGTIAALLKTTGRHEITLCTRRPLEILTVETPDGVMRMKARNIMDPAQAEAVDWVLVATKAYDAEGAGAWFQELCREGAPVAVLQNGVEHRERFAKYVKAEQILPVVIDCPAERREDGTVVQRGVAQMHVEEDELGREFAELFGGSKAQVVLTDDFLTAAWRKLCMNAAGAIPALVRKPVGVLQDEVLGQIALAMVTECVAVGRAEGARIEDGMGEQVLARCRAQPADSINSILADRMAGRLMEIDARNGAIVRKGKKHGISTPLNAMAVALLETMGENGWYRKRPVF
ncbi:MAG TPA: 2-dehydropantoate 2-reductase [Acidobacteriaceae bacterium]|jgi:2-dehydropantoate 2-reductase|nr:2-dehydropantoate 2-reductase [Acidobacteriaceae bacterium]